MKNLKINENRLMLNGNESLALQQRVNTLFEGTALVMPMELPKVLKKVLKKEKDDGCNHWDCFIVSYKCTCEGDCDGCEGRRSGR